jgi:hypothetical protein
MSSRRKVMRTYITTVLLMGALSAVPAVGRAATASEFQTTTAAKRSSTNAAPTHATRGVVKSVDASTLVITPTGKQHGEMTFALNSSTHREGNIAVGTPVSVGYHEDGKTNVATAVTVQPSKQPAGHTSSSKK